VLPEVAGSEEAAEAMAKIVQDMPDCAAGTFVVGFRAKHPDLTSRRAWAELRAMAFIIILSNGPLEAGHAGMRRAIAASGVQGPAKTLEGITGKELFRWVGQEARAVVDPTAKEAAEPPERRPPKTRRGKGEGVPKLYSFMWSMWLKKQHVAGGTKEQRIASMRQLGAQFKAIPRNSAEWQQIKDDGREARASRRLLGRAGYLAAGTRGEHADRKVALKEERRVKRQEEEAGEMLAQELEEAREEARVKDREREQRRASYRREVKEVRENEFKEVLLELCEDLWDLRDSLFLLSVSPPVLKFAAFGHEATSGTVVPDAVYEEVASGKVGKLCGEWSKRLEVVKESQV
jgi:hypothetical protein